MKTSIAAKNLIALRQSRNLTQEDLALELHVSRQAISKWENAYSLPNIDTLLVLSKFYGVSINDILEPICKKTICDFEEIIELDKSKLKLLLSSFDSVEIVKAAIGSSPQVNLVLKEIFTNIDFSKERSALGSIKIKDIEDVQKRMVDRINQG